MNESTKGKLTLVFEAKSSLTHRMNQWVLILLQQVCVGFLSRAT